MLHITILSILFLFPQIEFDSGRVASSDFYTKKAESPNKTYKVNNENWKIILNRYLIKSEDGEIELFNYTSLLSNKKDLKLLDDYLFYLARVSTKFLTKNESVAYYANLYNAATVKLIADNYPIKSIRKLGPFNSGPWKRKVIKLNGEIVSLDDIEHKILRSQYPSPYIHYMLNCASISCPTLQATPWNGETLETDQLRAASVYINSSKGVNLKKDGLHLSSIYKWFKEDFKNDGGVIDHILKHADEDLKRAIIKDVNIRSYHYDWTLNDVIDK